MSSKVDPLPQEIRNISSRVDQLQQESLCNVLMLQGAAADGLLADSPPDDVDVAAAEDVKSVVLNKLNLKKCM